MKSSTSSQNLLELAQVLSEKCELKQAGLTFSQALKQAKKAQDPKSIMEAIAGLLRLAVEALDEPLIEKWDRELNRFMKTHPSKTPPMAWYCKGAVARHRCEWMLAQRHFHRYLRAVKNLSDSDVQVAKGWVMLAVILQQRNRLRRSLWLAHEILRRYDKMNLGCINGITYLLLGTLSERQKDLKASMQWYQKAHVQFMGDHNWYYHLYVLYGYARIARQQQNYSQAYWYLDLLDKAASAPAFGLLRREIFAERKRLEQGAIDLLIDSRKGSVKTREIPEVSLRKQYVLMHILEALSTAHKKPGSDREKGLSKAEIIETVWKEPYKPDLHDNKLYYNINRLRKLIEPDVHRPQYLLNWKKGYRLAPGLKIQFIADPNSNLEGPLRGEE